MSTNLAAFEPFANATLTVELATAPTEDVPSDGWVLSPNGNPVPSPVDIGQVSSPVYEKTYKCHFRQIKSPEIENIAGVNMTTFYLDGMLLEPREFDEEIFPNQTFRAEFNNLIGTFELRPDQFLFPEFTSILGNRITGIFRLSGAGQS